MSVIGIASFIIWELHTPYPAVNLRILKNRGFAAAVFRGGARLRSLRRHVRPPDFLQDMRNYTAQQTGLIMLPGAIATTMMMPLVGKLVSRFPARNLVAAGAIGVVGSMLLLGRIAMDTGPGHMFWPLALRGAALGFLFVPLTLATLIGLHGKDMADATGLYNLARQIGGSMGIALLSTFLDHRTAMHRAVLVENINLYGAAALDRISALQQYFVSQGSALPVAHQQALALINQQVQGQASVLGFEDVFRISAIVFVAALPLLLLFKKGKPIPGHKPDVH